MSRAIAVAGLPGSGKTTVAKIVERAGYRYYNLGDVVREAASRFNIPPDKAAVVLRLEDGRRAVVKRLGVAGDNAVVDGVRSLEEIEALEELFAEVILLYVVASRSTRYKRLMERGRSDDPTTHFHFLARDLREIRFGLADLLARADYIIVNENKTLEDLERELTAVL